jgi:hypothetical protein
VVYGRLQQGKKFVRVERPKCTEWAWQKGRAGRSSIESDRRRGGGDWWESILLLVRDSGWFCPIGMDGGRPKSFFLVVLLQLKQIYS